MRYRSLGKCGTRVSVLSLGGWTTFGGTVRDKSVVRDIMIEAFEAGINFFDIADVYAEGEAERVMGEVLRELPRNRYLVSSKTFFPMSDDVNDRGLSRKHIMESVNASLKRLGTDYLDLYFCHRYDENTPLEETVRAMEDLVRQGKILYWGTSMWAHAQLRDAHGIADRRNGYAPQVEQPEYSLLAREHFENETLGAARELGMGTVVWSPLASGLLTGKYDEGIPEDSRFSNVGWIRDEWLTEDRRQRVIQMKEIADGLGCSRAQLALAWLIRQPEVSSVITGATRLAQLHDNLKALSIEVPDEADRRLRELFPHGI